MGWVTLVAIIAATVIVPSGFCDVAEMDEGYHPVGYETSVANTAFDYGSASNARVKRGGNCETSTCAALGMCSGCKCDCRKPNGGDVCRCADKCATTSTQDDNRKKCISGCILLLGFPCSCTGNSVDDVVAVCNNAEAKKILEECNCPCCKSS